MTTIQTGLMSVHTFEFDRHIVDIQITASLAKLILRSRSITNLHLANAKESADTVDSLTLLVGELSNEDMTIRLLGIPLLGPRQRQRQSLMTSLVSLAAERSYSLASNLVAIQLDRINLESIIVDLLSLLASILDIHIHLDDRSLTIDTLRTYSQVVDFHLRRRRQIRTAEDTRQAEHILRLKE